MAVKHEAPLNGIGGFTDTYISRANAFKYTLLKKSANIPVERRQDMLNYILKIANQINGGDLQSLSIEDLKDIENFTCSIRPHTQHGEVVVQYYDCDDFAILWRQHFVKHTDPKSLPSYWHPDRRVYQEAKEKQVSKGRDWDMLKDD